MEKQEHRRCTDTCQDVSTQPYPWLVYSHGIDRQKQTFYNIVADRYHTKSIPTMRDKKICFSDHGWVLLQDYSTARYSLLNMTTMEEEIQLPDLPAVDRKFCLCQILTSSPSSDPSSRIMFIVGSATDDFVMSCHPGDDHFVRHRFTVDDDSHLYAATCINRKLYGLTGSMDLVVADISTDPLEIRSQKLIVDESLDEIFIPFQTTSYLMECNKEIFLVWMQYFARGRQDITGFRLFRADTSTKAWAEVKNIGEQHAIFIDNAHAFCMETGGSIKGNCIYFTESENRSLYTYSFEDQCITMTLPCRLSATVVPESDDSVWILIPHLFSDYH